MDEAAELIKQQVEMYLKVQDYDRVAAENQRLREALEGMMDWFGQYPEFIPSAEGAVQNRVEAAIRRARAVLA